MLACHSWQKGTAARTQSEELIRGGGVDSLDHSRYRQGSEWTQYCVRVVRIKNMSWHMTRSGVSPSEKKLGNVVKLFWKWAHVELLAPGQTSPLC